MQQEHEVDGSGGSRRGGTRLARLAVAGAISLAALVLGAGPASASDIQGDRISWNSQIPCTDTASSSWVSTAPRYNAPYSGYYRTRVGLYRSDGARVALGPLRDVRAYSAGWINFARWESPVYSTRGETHVVGYVYRWDGSQYRLIAREQIPCL
jgi:hypothetical protein